MGKTVVLAAAFAGLLAGGVLAAAAGDAGSSLVYRTPRGVEFVVTADGLSAIRVAGRPRMPVIHGPAQG